VEIRPTLNKVRIKAAWMGLQLKNQTAIDVLFQFCSIKNFFLKNKGTVTTPESRLLIKWLGVACVVYFHRILGLIQTVTRKLCHRCHALQTFGTVYVHFYHERSRVELMQKYICKCAISLLTEYQGVHKNSFIPVHSRMEMLVFEERGKPK